MTENKKKVRIVWKEGLNSKGEPIWYQSLEEFEPITVEVKQETKCYHDWETYIGFMKDDKRCKLCGKIEDL